eukprot:CAMPEP_0119557730 /NCGR_PEP_ID=MMETSP1352-20130426/9297_1 /TAXON_ID=265584 /ORGANISM="Stauroneis constricta, Strain CCMP1120" /LENGTH=652 /DNA_ID=CAMNT_0007604871 /DNA_START=423 /DNA_END=2381 /DNA_ORIENTATION=+
MAYQAAFIPTTHWYDHVPYGLLLIVFVYIGFCCCILLLAPSCVENELLGIDKHPPVNETALDASNEFNGARANANASANANNANATSQGSIECFQGFIDDTTVSWASGYFVAFSCFVMAAHLCYYRFTSNLKYHRAIRPSAIVGTVCLGLAITVQSTTKLWFGSTRGTMQQQQQYPQQGTDYPFYSMYPISFILWMMSIVCYRRFAYTAYSTQKALYKYEHHQHSNHVPSDDNESIKTSSTTITRASLKSQTRFTKCRILLILVEVLLILTTITIVGASTSCSILNAKNDTSTTTTTMQDSEEDQDYIQFYQNNDNNNTICEIIVYTTTEFVFHFLLIIFWSICSGYYLQSAIRKKQSTVFQGYQFYYLGLKLQYATTLVPLVFGCVFVFDLVMRSFLLSSYDSYGTIIFHSSVLIATYCLHNISWSLTMPQSSSSSSSNPTRFRNTAGGAAASSNNNNNTDEEDDDQSYLFGDTQTKQQQHISDEEQAPPRWSSLDDLKVGTPSPFSRTTTNTTNDSSSTLSMTSSVSRSPPRRSLQTSPPRRQRMQTNTPPRRQPMQTNTSLRRPQMQNTTTPPQPQPPTINREHQYQLQEEKRQKRWKEHQKRKQQKIRLQSTNVLDHEENHVASSNNKIVSIAPIQEDDEEEEFGVFR